MNFEVTCKACGVTAPIKYREACFYACPCWRAEVLMRHGHVLVPLGKESTTVITMDQAPKVTP